MINIDVSNEAEHFASTWKEDDGLVRDWYVIPSNDGRNTDLHVLATTLEAYCKLNWECRSKLNGLNKELETEDESSACEPNRSRPGMTILLFVYKPNQAPTFEAFRPVESKTKHTG